MRSASPARRASVAGSSRLPCKGVIPRARSCGARAGEEVSPSTRTRCGNTPATRRPTSPQPTTSTRWRRKRLGKAPSGFWFEGKIGEGPATEPEDTQSMTAATAPTGPFQITVQPSGRQFSAEPGEAILPAAIRQGIGMPYGCKDGACGSCKCKKLEGTVVHGPHQAKALSPEEEASGLILTCCGVPQTDVVLESHQVTDESAFP